VERERKSMRMTLESFSFGITQVSRKIGLAKPPQYLGLSSPRTSLLAAQGGGMLVESLFKGMQ